MTARRSVTLFRSAAAWTAVGLAGGLGYREVTKAADFSGDTQLAVVHTHALVLGTVVLLGVLCLDRLFELSAQRSFTWFLHAWNTGLVLTVAGLTVKGILQVNRSSAAESPAIAGVSGLGHILLTIGFAALFVALGARIKQTTAASTSAV